MPKEITHWLIAQEAFLALPKNSPLKDVLAEHPNLYFTSAILLDTPYYCLGLHCHMMKDATNLFHHRQSNSFAPLEKILEAKPYISFEAELSFVAGIISHIITDSIFHPCISSYSILNSHQESIARHRLLETQIDLLFMKEFSPFGRKLLSTYMTSLEIHREDLAAVAAILLQINKKRSRTLIIKTFRDHCLVQGLFYKNWPLFPLLVLNKFKPGLTENTMALFYTYAKRNPALIEDQQFTYIHPVSGDTVSATLEQLKNEAVETTVDIYSQLATASTRQELKERLENVHGPNLVTGMPANKSPKHSSNTELNSHQ